LALAWLGASFFSEIEKFPREVLAYHYPDVPLHGDFTTIGENQYGSIDFLVGGTPCQSFSVAGLRKGLDDERGNLSLEFIKLAQRVRPRWVVWENVPGVLSSNGGRDFGSFLGALGEIGYGFAYRVLDAQYFGVAQRRRRVFVVGYFGDWRRAAAVLFERESLRGNPAPSREKGKKPAPTVTAGPPFSRTGNDRVECDANVTNWPAKVACTLNAAFAEKQGLEDQHINGGASLFVPQTIGPLTAGMSKGPRGTEGLESNHVLAFPSNANADSMAAIGNDLSPTLKHDPMAIQREMAVRRITPTECERLQGFPDGYTNIKDKCPDGPRYKALGNSMAVPVMKWIGERIQMVENYE
jgi:DNA (cytosine-5)-methyltransferase 1